MSRSTKGRGDFLVAIPMVILRIYRLCKQSWGQKCVETLEFGILMLYRSTCCVS